MPCKKKRFDNANITEDYNKYKLKAWLLEEIAAMGGVVNKYAHVHVYRCTHTNILYVCVCV